MMGDKDQVPEIFYLLSFKSKGAQRPPFRLIFSIKLGMPNPSSLCNVYPFGLKWESLGIAWVELRLPSLTPSLHTFYIDVLFSAACYRGENYGGFSQKHLPRTQFNSARRISLFFFSLLFTYAISGSVVSCAATNASNRNQSIPGPCGMRLLNPIASCLRLR